MPSDSGRPDVPLGVCLGVEINIGKLVYSNTECFNVLIKSNALLTFSVVKWNVDFFSYFD